MRRSAITLALVTLVAVAGCGRSGHGAETDPEEASDARILNSALGGELTAVRAYDRGLPLLRGRLRELGRELRGQDQEYVDALTKAIRGVGGTTTAEPGKPDLSAFRSRARFLALAYELESAALASYLDATSRLATAAPRTLATSLAAGHAQHLVVLRQGLGAGLAAAVPEAFDGGEVPPPAAKAAGAG